MKMRILSFLSAWILLSLSVLLCGCGNSQRKTAEFWSMGTAVTVTLYGSDAAAAAGSALAESTLAELDGLWSLNHADSDISRLNASDDGISNADEGTVALVRQAQELSALTGGSFDITLAPLSALWQECGKADRLPTAEEISVRLAHVGTAALTADGKALGKPEGTEVDLGAIAKGAAVAILAEKLSAVDGIRGGLISMGSCVVGFGAKPDGKPFRVSVRDPKKRNEIAGTLTLEAGQVLSVSGDYERFVTIGGKNYHHILDPATGYPSDSGLSSVAVIAQDGPTADALSTALMVMGEDAARSLYRSGKLAFEAVFFRCDGTISVTDHIGFQKQ